MYIVLNMGCSPIGTHLWVNLVKFQVSTHCKFQAQCLKHAESYSIVSNSVVRFLCFLTLSL